MNTEQNIKSYVNHLFDKGRRVSYESFSNNPNEIMTKDESEKFAGLLIARDLEREGGSIFNLLRAKGSCEMLESISKWLINKDFFGFNRLTLLLENILIDTYKSEINRLLEEKEMEMANYFNEGFHGVVCAA